MLINAGLIIYVLCSKHLITLGQQSPTVLVWWSGGGVRRGDSFLWVVGMWVDIAPFVWRLPLAQGELHVWGQQARLVWGELCFVYMLAHCLHSLVPNKPRSGSRPWPGVGDPSFSWIRFWTKQFLCGTAMGCILLNATDSLIPLDKSTLCLFCHF